MQPVLLTWAGGEHDFMLPLGNLRAVQQACDAGPNEVMIRLRVGTWRVDDVLAPLRQGLMGCGMAQAEARDLVERAADSAGLLALTVPAMAVLAHALSGPADDQPGEAEGATEAAPENGASRKSTVQAP